MDAFLTRNLSTKEIRLVNNWRKFFQVNTLVDICDPMGTKIEKVFLKRPNGTFLYKSHQSILQWPIQDEPGPRGFALWKKCLKECFNMQSNGCITHCFGKWIPENYHLQNKCSTYYQPSTQQGYIRDNDTFKYYTSMATRSASITCNRLLATTIAILPNDCIPAELYRKRNIIQVKFSKLTSEVSSRRQFSDIKEDEIPWRRAILEHVEVINETLIQQNDIETFNIISDGGVC